MSDDEEDYVSFGKPLNELVEGENIRKRPISVEEQIATDRNGKRRFHGAFTGGFSAGHFNTVDTPQGWTPLQFKSSRDSKTDKKEQKPEDFMDDEDFSAFGFAPHALKTKSSFQSSDESSRSKVNQVEKPGGVLAPVLSQLIQPARSSVGERLLRKQGWKPGQGIGPKSNKKQKQDRKASFVKTYGGDNYEENDDPNLDKYKDFLFAPDDLPVYAAYPKENLFGIGYRGLDRPGMPAGGMSTQGFNVKSGVSRKKFSITGEAFGVGAYEEEDDDVYNRNDMGDYDYSLDVGGDSASKRKKDPQNASVSRLTDILEGFVMSTRKSMLKKQFPAPHIPREWRPTTQGYVKKSRFDQVDHEIPAVKIKNPTRDQRKSILLPENKELENKVKVEIPPAKEIKEEPKEEDSIPAIAAGHSSFKPFEAKPEKQKRYEQFLVCIENNRRDGLKILQPKTMTEWERERERVEFEKAAALYKPMRTNMASRFVSAGTTNDIKEDQSKDEKSKAAEMKMFGKLTRETAEWVPARILCVRFNVKNPFGDQKEAETKKKKADFGVNQLFSVLDSRELKASNDTESSSSAKSPTNDNNADVKEEAPAKIILVRDEESLIKTEKPAMDLFKAIFANSDSEEDSSDDSEPDNTPAKPIASHYPRSQDDSNGKEGDKSSRPPAFTESSSAPNTDSPRGIFAGINFDKFVRQRKKTPPPIVVERVAKHRPKSILDRSVRNILGIKSGDQSEDEYGPTLPPPIAKGSSIVISSDSESDEWEEKSKKKKSKSKKHKKEKKKKKKKHKSKE